MCIARGTAHVRIAFARSLCASVCGWSVLAHFDPNTLQLTDVQIGFHSDNAVQPQTLESTITANFESRFTRIRNFQGVSIQLQRIHDVAVHVTAIRARIQTPDDESSLFLPDQLQILHLLKSLHLAGNGQGPACDIANSLHGMLHPNDEHLQSKTSTCPHIS